MPIVKVVESWYNINVRTWLVEVPAVHSAEQAAYHLVHLGRRYLATMHWDMNIKGLGRKRIVSSDFLHVRGGFKWKKWR
jgi:hypothetical protein